VAAFAVLENRYPEQRETLGGRQPRRYRAFAGEGVLGRSLLGSEPRSSMVGSKTL
jgi:hypothetical protein